jgi:hypothetical protein
VLTTEFIPEDKHRYHCGHDFLDIQDQTAYILSR